MNTLGRAAARSNVLMSPLVAVAGLAATVVVVRAIPPVEFAIYAVVLSFRSTVQFASDFGTGAASTRVFGELQARRAAGQARRVYVRLLAIRGLIALLLLAGIALVPAGFADLLGLEDDERDVIPILAAIGAAETLSSLGYYTLAGLLRHRWINHSILLATIAQPIAVIVAVVAGWGLVGIIAGLLVGSLLRVGAFHVGAIVALRKLGDAAETQDGVARTYIRTATGSVIGKIAAWIHSRQLVTLIAIQTAPRTSVAVFALAYDLVQQVASAVASPLSSLLLPLQAAAAGDDPRTRRVYQTAVRLLAFVLVPTAAILLAVFPVIVELLFPDAYAEAAVFAAIFVPAAVIETVLSGPATALMLSDDRGVGIFARIKLVSALLGLTYFAIAGADLLLVAAAMLAIRAATTFWLVFAAHRGLGIPVGGPWVSRLLPVSALAGLAAFVSTQAFQDPGLSLALGGLAGGGVLLVLVRRLQLIETADADLVRGIVPGLSRVIDRLAPPRSV